MKEALVSCQVGFKKAPDASNFWQPKTKHSWNMARNILKLWSRNLWFWYIGNLAFLENFLLGRGLICSSISHKEAAKFLALLPPTLISFATAWYLEFCTWIQSCSVLLGRWQTFCWHFHMLGIYISTTAAVVRSNHQEWHYVWRIHK